MAFLNRIFRNRGLVENLSRDPVARIEPIAPLLNPIGSFPQISQQPIVPIRPIVSTPLQARRQELENLGYDAADVQEDFRKRSRERFGQHNFKCFTY